MVRSKVICARLAVSTAVGAALFATASANAAEDDQAPEVQAETGEELPAEAQPQSTFGGEILVTAQKRSQRTQDIGLSIAAFGSDQLEQANVETVQDIATLVPGFTVAKSFRGPPIYTLRGVGFNTPNMSTSSPVGIYLDEIAYPYPILTEGLSFDLERVEVLKGPQGTLYGRNTTGGLVNLIARKPSHENMGEVKLQYGSYQSYGVSGFLNGGVTETLAARLAFNVEQADKGWQQSVSRPGDRLGEVDKVAARLSLAFEPSASARFLLTGNWWRDRSDTQAAQAIAVLPKGYIAFFGHTTVDQWRADAVQFNVPPAIFDQAYTPTSATQANWVAENLPWGGTVGGDNWTPAPLDFRKDNEMISVALRAEVDLNDSITLTSLTSYADLSRREGTDAAGWEIENAIFQARSGLESFSQELRLTGESDNLNWIAGLFYARDKISENDRTWGATISTVSLVRSFGALFAPPTTSQADLEDIIWGFRDWQNTIDETVTSKAIFGQAEFKPAYDLTITAGIRYTDDSTKFAGCSRDQGDNSIAASWNGFFNFATPFGANVPPGGCVTYLADLNPAGGNVQGVVRKRLDENNLSGRIAVDYRINPSAMVYVSAARGFKSGAFPNIDANVAPQYDPAKQEEVLAFEAGFKTNPVPGMLFNGTVFYYDYKDKQLFVNTPDPVYVTLNSIKNIPQSHIFGIEGELAVPVGDQLELRVSGTYLDAKIDEYNGFNDFGVARDFEGASFPFTPKFQFSGTATYRFDLSDNWSGRLSLTARYSDKSRGDLEGDPLFKIDSYALFDANLNIANVGDGYEFEAFVKNIGNKYYWNSVQLNQDSLVRYAGMPRTWGVAVTKKF